jgi:hypothetical protein
MDTELEKTPANPSDTSPAFYMGDLDDETLEILIEDKIATGG